MSRRERPESRNRTAIPGATLGADRQHREDAVVAEFLAATNRLVEMINRKAEEAVREHSDPDFDLDFDRQTRDLKQANAAIRKIIAPLENLKKAINRRLEDLRWFRDSLDPDSPRYHDL